MQQSYIKSSEVKSFNPADPFIKLLPNHIVFSLPVSEKFTGNGYFRHTGTDKADWYMEYIYQVVRLHSTIQQN